MSKIGVLTLGAIFLSELSFDACVESLGVLTEPCIALLCAAGLGEAGVVEFDKESLIGERDRARSVENRWLAAAHHHPAKDTPPPMPTRCEQCFTFAPSLPGCSALHYLFLQLSCAFFILSVALVTKFSNAPEEVIDVFGAIIVNIGWHCARLYVAVSK